MAKLNIEGHRLKSATVYSNDKNIVIPDDVRIIEPGAFRGTNVQNITLSKNLSIIGSSAFADCPNLKSITIPDNVKMLSVNTFANSGIEHINTGKGVQTILSGCFKNCKNLQSADLSGNVNEIGNNAFKDCTNLQEVKLSNGLQTIGENAFENCSNLKEITLPDHPIDSKPNSFEKSTSLWISGQPKLFSNDIAETLKPSEDQKKATKELDYEFNSKVHDIEISAETDKNPDFNE